LKGGINQELSEDAVIEKVIKISENNQDLLQYEKDKIRKSL
jgi:hypothetical protein